MRRFELALRLSTADQAVNASFEALFFPLSDVGFPGQRLLSGFARLPPESANGALLFGRDAGTDDTPRSLDIDVSFDGQSVRGTVRALASTAYVTGSFPLSDAN